MKHWRLKSKEERRFKQGHPWVYSNELQESPKGVQPGELLRLDDAGGNFLAYGFGNPSSLIAFRAISRQAREDGDANEILQTILQNNLKSALEFRLQWFSPGQSFRMVYGENDDLPGLVIDRYAGKKEVVYVVQPHSAGMDHQLPLITETLAAISKALDESADTKVVYRRDAGSREREGLSKEPTEVRFLHTGKTVESHDPYREFTFQLQSVMNREVGMTVDLVTGQKTGFFFDQAHNAKLVQILLLRKLRYWHSPAMKAGKMKMLDLCSYVGQWSVQLAQVFMEKGLPLEITAVDASDTALKFAERNVRQNTIEQGADGIRFHRLKADVLEPMPTLKDRDYEVVIADPPAFIKNRKSIPQGKHAYAQLFTTAIQKTAKDGMVVCCSCSQLLSREDMKECLQKAARRSGRKVRWIAEGSPSQDHFLRSEFEEGHYLKAWIGQVE
jgi:23S rRNA (cytosine1962-C5)-methyltransferase